ncbi:hypothetical protein KJ068_28410 [bacterium]|nr:hypothetical protein [bacterium]
MKRLFTFIAATALLLAAFKITTSHSEAAPSAPVQFQGFVTYGNGNPAPIGTRVRVYLGGELKGEVYITVTNGFYQITGNHNDFPTGNYGLNANDLIGAVGSKSCFKVNETENQECDIVMDLHY